MEKQRGTRAKEKDIRRFFFFCCCCCCFLLFLGCCGGCSCSLVAMVSRQNAKGTKEPLHGGNRAKEWPIRARERREKQPDRNYKEEEQPQARKKIARATRGKEERRNKPAGKAKGQTARQNHQRRKQRYKEWEGPSGGGEGEEQTAMRANHSTKHRRSKTSRGTHVTETASRQKTPGLPRATA